MNTIYAHTHASMAVIVIAMILLTTTAINMVMSELQARRLDAHVEQILVGFNVLRTPFLGLLDRLRWLGELSRRFYASANLEYLRGVIQASGFNPHKTLPLLLGDKLVLTASILALSVLGAFFIEAPLFKIVTVGAGVIVGILGPEWILAFVRMRFKAAVQRGTPDALDLLVVCNEAGMGLEPALERVAQEMQHTNRPMATILFGLLDDIRVLPNRHDAFANLGRRSGVDGLRRFGTMLSQSLQYGTPLSHVLHSVSAELRRDRMTKLEEIAVKLPAKLIFPLIFFIMPSFYIVLLGTSIMRLTASLEAIINS